MTPSTWPTSTREPIRGPRCCWARRDPGSARRRNGPPGCGPGSRCAPGSTRSEWPPPPRWPSPPCAEPGAREAVPPQVRRDCNGRVLIEREHVLGRLTAFLDDAATGSGRLVFLTGEAGIGKTSVVAALTDVARRRVAVRWGACDSVATAALGPFTDAVPE